MSEYLSTVLDQALARLQAGEQAATILADYPEHQDELAPLLETARQLSSLRSGPKPVDVEPGLRAFLAEARALCSGRPQPVPSWKRVRNWFLGSGVGRHQRALRAVACTVSVALTLFGLLGGTVALADESLPGDAIYPAKLAGEEARLVLTVRQAARAECHLSRAVTRVDELERLVRVGRPIYESTVVRLGRSLQASLLVAATAKLGDTVHLLMVIERTAAEQASRLAALEAGISGQAGQLPTGVSQLLHRAWQDLDKAERLARAGKADVQAFRLLAAGEAWQAGAPSTIRLSTAIITMATAGDTGTAAPARSTALASPSSTPPVTVRVQEGLPTSEPTPTAQLGVTRPASAKQTATPLAMQTREETALPGGSVELSPTPTSTLWPSPTATSTWTPTSAPTVTLAPRVTSMPEVTQEPTREAHPTRKPHPTPKPAPKKP